VVVLFVGIFLKQIFALGVEEIQIYAVFSLEYDKSYSCLVFWDSG